MPNHTTTIAIEELREAGSDGGNLMGYFCRGHVPQHDFAQACNEYTEAEPGWDIRYVKPEQCAHVWWRCVPISGDDGHTAFHPALPNTRGAFPATVWDGITRQHIRTAADTVKTFREGRDHGMREGVNWVLEQLDRINPEVRDAILRIWRAKDPTKEFTP